ncbi:OmpA family protein [Chromobacterium sp. IIBBL 290-4]|uniref:OmpA family protein n=1 Tax=Chromobacterium sp. IIBBL 290-4 TaxID=2953890 RepID=UPI0020B8E119|nr:OmpA family protein [Chromobacterium sp. IIBBL 290-4]UTH76613.1 CpaD family pilus assembly lipoprotein [Chromobacterium sp. IIBBL 290-4]
MKRLFSALLVSLLCSACVTTPKADSTTSQAEAAAANDPKVQAAKQAAVNYAADATLIPFEKMSAKLTPVGEAQLDLLVPKLKTAKSIVIRGHCYRRDIGNAKAAAQARAASVRQYLLVAGVPSSKIDVRYDTERSLHGVRLVVAD